MIMSVHVVPSKAASFSLGPSTLNSRPVSSRGESARLVEVPWFARPIYSEEEVEMYPLYSPPATAGGSAAVAAVKNLQKSANHFNYKLSTTAAPALENPRNPFRAVAAAVAVTIRRPPPPPTAAAYPVTRGSGHVMRCAPGS